MKKIILLICFYFGILSCASQAEKSSSDKGISKIENGKITISNPELEYEVIIFDAGFESWLQTRGKQRGYYDLAYLENKNRVWVNSWNSRSRAGKAGYDYTIDYHSNVNYGFEVNYMLFNYLLYWQETNNIRLN
ncbi:hypothetical protein EG240_06995 [Paenimyroides tangerinum]|uniref:Lipoprotein n=1 Tax=Paenimyroides tangerinum TaxID=2488728 RepID=A0A3P3W938_9FLAO|nr:DUF6146 family protein [Paenimyroides tangerinum]RRJ90948.1 hypothetical protein EG240_06995 [Paenimyroides tangerinum]